MSCIKSCLLLAVVGIVSLGIAGCGSSDSSASGNADSQTIIQIEGSDTMVNLAQAWAEEYTKQYPNISVQVSGGGSGVGIASLTDGICDMANASRQMKDKEKKKAEANSGKIPGEFIVGLDALAVYVHVDNPIDSVSISELAGIYGEAGELTTWKQLGIDNAACKSDEIVRVSRQNNSGTYHYFRKAVLGTTQDYKLGSTDMSGSKDVVALVSRTPCAIGYSGMGYKTDDVKWLRVSQAKGEQGVEPSVDAAADGSYPIARPLYIYTLGEPTGIAKDYLDWILSPAGQKVVLETGYVPIGAVDNVADALEH